MAAATVTSGYPLRESVGSLTLFIWKLSACADTNTLATGLGVNLIGAWANSEGDETAGEEGVNVVNSSGTLTFGLKTTSIVWVYALARA